MVQSGLRPLDYKLVEERRSDGIMIGYFRKRIETDLSEDGHPAQN
jgi:hypothetical protein